jgi:hypothetical protein
MLRIERETLADKNQRRKMEKQITVYVRDWTEEDFNDQSAHPELLDVDATADELDAAIAKELEKLSGKQSVFVERDNSRIGEIENGNPRIEKRLAEILRDDGIFRLDGWSGVYTSA